MNGNIEKSRSTRASAFLTPPPALTALSAIAAAVFLTVGATGCGKSMVKGVDFTTQVQGDQVFASVGTNIDLGKIQLPALTLPIGGNSGGAIGALTLSNVGGQNHVAIGINVTQALKTSAMDGSLLPNGNAVPVSLGAGVQTLAFKAGGSSRVYLAVNGRDVMIGFALVISALDSVGKVVPIAVDIFPQFKISNSLSGVGGFFTSPVAGQSGLAFFARSVGSLPAANTNAALLLAQDSGARLMALNSGESGAMSALKAAASNATKNATRAASARDISSVEQGLYKLQSKGGTVTIQ